MYLEDLKNTNRKIQINHMIVGTLHTLIFRYAHFTAIFRNSKYFNAKKAIFTEQPIRFTCCEKYSFWVAHLPIDYSRCPSRLLTGGRVEIIALSRECKYKAMSDIPLWHAGSRNHWEATTLIEQEFEESKGKTLDQTRNSLK